MNKRTCLYDRNVGLRALIRPFGGFDMPIQYSSIVDEHDAVRRHCGVFDVSHMGEIFVEGKDAVGFANHIFTNDIGRAPVGTMVYGMLCRPDGGVVDDTCACRLAEDRVLFTVNAANIDKDNEWFARNSGGFDVVIGYESDRYGQLAIQGPEAERCVEEALGIACGELKFYEVKEVDVEGERIIVSRSGYTGEDGFEVYASHGFIVRSWDKLMAAGVAPCGLGCRDTLRFEAGLPLYGDELSESITPVMAGLVMFCKFDKGEFIGKEALQRQMAEGPARRLCGVRLDGRAVPRHGYRVFKDGTDVGEVTTGYRLISVDESCCVALVDADAGRLGGRLEVQIRGKMFPETVVKKRFYSPKYKK